MADADAGPSLGLHRRERSGQGTPRKPRKKSDWNDGPIPEPYLALAPPPMASATPDPTPTGLILPSDYVRSITNPHTSGRYSANLLAPRSIVPGGGGNAGGGSGGGGSGSRPLPSSPSPGPSTTRHYAANLLSPPSIMPGGNPSQPLVQQAAAPQHRPLMLHQPRSSPYLRGDSVAQANGSTTTLLRTASPSPNPPRRRTRRVVNSVIQSRPLTVASLEEGRAIGLARGASMRRTNVWDDLPESNDPLPPFPFPTASNSRLPPIFSVDETDEFPAAEGTLPPYAHAPEPPSASGGNRPHSPPPSFEVALNTPFNESHSRLLHLGSADLGSRIARTPSPGVETSNSHDEEGEEDDREDRRMWNADILAGYTLIDRVGREAARGAEREQMRTRSVSDPRIMRENMARTAELRRAEEAAAALAQAAERAAREAEPDAAARRAEAEVASVEAARSIERRHDVEMAVAEANGGGGRTKTPKGDLEDVVRQTIQALGPGRATKEQILAAARASLAASGRDPEEDALPSSPVVFVDAPGVKPVFMRAEEPGVYYRLIQKKERRPKTPQPNQPVPDDIPQRPASAAGGENSQHLRTPSMANDGLLGPPGAKSNSLPRAKPRSKSGTVTGRDMEQIMASIVTDHPPQMPLIPHSFVQSISTDNLSRQPPTKDRAASLPSPMAETPADQLKTKWEIIDALEKESAPKKRLSQESRPLLFASEDGGASLISRAEEPGVLYRLVTNEEAKKKKKKTKPPTEKKRGVSPNAAPHQSSPRRVPTSTATSEPSPSISERSGMDFRSSCTRNASSTSLSSTAKRLSVASSVDVPKDPVGPPPPLPPRPPAAYVSEYKDDVGASPSENTTEGRPQTSEDARVSRVRAASFNTSGSNSPTSPSTSGRVSQSSSRLLLVPEGEYPPWLARSTAPPTPHRSLTTPITPSATVVPAALPTPLPVGPAEGMGGWAPPHPNASGSPQSMPPPLRNGSSSSSYQLYQAARESTASISPATSNTSIPTAATRPPSTPLPPIFPGQPAVHSPEQSFASPPQSISSPPQTFVSPFSSPMTIPKALPTPPISGTAPTQHARRGSHSFFPPQPPQTQQKQQEVPPSAPVTASPSIRPFVASQSSQPPPGAQPQHISPTVNPRPLPLFQNRYQPSISNGNTLHRIVNVTSEEEARHPSPSREAAMKRRELVPQVSALQSRLSLAEAASDDSPCGPLVDVRPSLSAPPKSRPSGSAREGSPPSSPVPPDLAHLADTSDMLLSFLQSEGDVVRNQRLSPPPTSPTKRRAPPPPPPPRHTHTRGASSTTLSSSILEGLRSTSPSDMRSEPPTSRPQTVASGTFRQTHRQWPSGSRPPPPPPPPRSHAPAPPSEQFPPRPDPENGQYPLLVQTSVPSGESNPWDRPHTPWSAQSTPSARRPPPPVPPVPRKDAWHSNGPSPETSTSVGSSYLQPRRLTLDNLQSLSSSTSSLVDTSNEPAPESSMTPTVSPQSQFSGSNGSPMTSARDRPPTRGPRALPPIPTNAVSPDSVNSSASSGPGAMMRTPMPPAPQPLPQQTPQAAPPPPLPPAQEVTDLDLFVARLEGSGREYEGFQQLTQFLGPGRTPGATPEAVATLLPGPVVVDSRRIDSQGRVKLKMSVLGARVTSCPICLAQFRGYDAATLLPRCGHVAHESCARRWFKEGASCMVCREPLQ